MDPLNTDLKGQGPIMAIGWETTILPESTIWRFGWKKRKKKHRGDTVIWRPPESKNVACGLPELRKSNQYTCGGLKLIRGSKDKSRGARSRIRRVDEVRSDRVVKTIFVWRLKPVDGDGLFYVRKLMGWPFGPLLRKNSIERCVQSSWDHHRLVGSLWAPCVEGGDCTKQSKIKRQLPKCFHKDESEAGSQPLPPV